MLDVIFQDGTPVTARAGGGMLNTAVSLARSGIQVALISETGDDETAGILLNFVKNNNIGTKYIKKYYHQKTSIAIAHLDQNKIPAFSIYKSYPDNRRLIFPKSFTKGDILVFGSIYSLDPEIRNNILEIVTHAKQAGAILVYDPNIRKHNLEKSTMKKAVFENFSMADIIKGSDEDFENIFGTKHFDEIVEEIRKINAGSALIITRGKDGLKAYGANKKFNLPAIETNVVSTIGAGDAFTAGLVYSIEKLKASKDKNNISSELIFKEMLESGLRFSAEVCATFDNYISGK